MTNRIRILFLFSLFSNLFINSKAQKITLGDVFDAPNTRTDVQDVIGSNSTGVYWVRNSIIGGHRKVWLEHLDWEMNHTNSVVMPFRQEEMKLDYLKGIFNKKKIIVFWAYKDVLKEKNFIYKQDFSITSLEPTSSLKLVSSISSEKNWTANLTPSFRISADTSHITYYNIEHINDSTSQLKWYILNRDGEIIRTLLQEIPNKNGNTSINNFTINNLGEIGIVYREELKAIKAFVSYKKTFSEVPISNIHKGISTCVISAGPDDYWTVSGFYNYENRFTSPKSKDNSKRWIGAFAQKAIEGGKLIGDPVLYPFSNEEMRLWLSKPDTKELEKDQKKGFPGGFKFYALRNFVTYSDGRVLLVAEERYTIDYGSVRGNHLLVNLDLENGKHWLKMVPKNHLARGYDWFLDFSLMVTPENQYLFFLDRVKNLSLIEGKDLPKQVTTAWNGRPNKFHSFVIVKVNENSIEKKQLFSPTSINSTPRAGRGFKVGNNKLIFQAHNSKAERWILLDFEEEDPQTE